MISLFTLALFLARPTAKFTQCSTDLVDDGEATRQRFQLFNNNNNNKESSSSSSSSQSREKFQRDSSKTIQDLYQFLQEQECEGFESLAIGWTRNEEDGSSMRGLFATQDFDAGEYLLAIPFPATLLVQERIIDPEDSNAQDSEMEQAVAFLDNFATHSAWKPYVDCLPRVLDQSSFDGTPDFWTRQTLDKCPIPRLRKQSLDRLYRIQAESSSQKGRHATQDLQWAMWILRSRGFTSLKQTSGKLRELTILMPLIDMINHDGHNPNASIEVIETNVDEESFVALQATRPIANTEQITLRYGTGFETSLELLDKYGFWTDSNPNDDRIDWDLVDSALLDGVNTGDNHHSQDPSLLKLRRFSEHLDRLRKII